MERGQGRRSEPLGPAGAGSCVRQANGMSVALAARFDFHTAWSDQAQDEPGRPGGAQWSFCAPFRFSPEVATTKQKLWISPFGCSQRFQRKVRSAPNAKGLGGFLVLGIKGQVLGAWLLVAVAMRLARARELEASEAPSVGPQKPFG